VSQYYGCLGTSKGVKLKSVETFKKDLLLLQQMFEYVLDSLEFEYHHSEPYVYVGGDESASLEVEVDEWGEWAERLPPDDWTDEQKAAHADAFGYLSYYRKFCDPEGSGEVNLIAFLQHHMTEDCVAIMDCVSHEAGSLWYWSVAFSHDDVVWQSMDDAHKVLEEKLKESSR
jgi:hypothetical protein